jgi:hypothetical protein
MAVQEVTFGVLEGTVAEEPVQCTWSVAEAVATQAAVAEDTSEPVASEVVVALSTEVQTRITQEVFKPAMAK